MSWEGTLFNSEKRVAREHICSKTKAVLCACVFLYVCVCVCVCVCVVVGIGCETPCMRMRIVRGEW